MTDVLMEYELVIRTADDTADDLVVSSVRGDALPYLTQPPTVDGSEFDPLTGSYRSGSATFLVADAITSGTNRVVTSQLEDAHFRQQLGNRKAYGRQRENGGAWETIQAGIVTGVRMSSTVEWAIEVGDTTMAGRNLSAFAPKRDPTDFTKIEPLADYLARWPNRGTMAGGPVLGGFLGMADLGGWEMEVRTPHSIFGTTVKYLHFLSGYTAPGFGRTTNIDDVAAALNEAVGEPSGRSVSTFAAEMPVPSAWRDVVVQVNGAPYSAHKVGGYTFNAAGTASALLPDTPFISGGIHVDDPTNALTVGARVRVRVFDALPSERSPIYWRGHPVDLAAKLCDEAGIAYDATEAANTKTALGPAFCITLRITSSQAWSSFVESVLYGPCGFSARTLPNSALAFFATRILSSTLPSVTITSADVPEGQGTLFDLSQPDAITKVVYEQQNLVPAGGEIPSTPADGQRVARRRVENPPLDGISVQKVTVERTSGDSGASVDKEQRYTIPGFLDTGSMRYDPQLVDVKAAEIFDRDGRGRLTGELSLLRTGAGGDVVLGQELVNALPAMPNHNKRLGDDNTVPGRCLQIVRLTMTPAGPVVRLKDSGPNAQPLTTLPTLTIAAGPSGSTVTVTITNAATLNAASPPIAVRLQWATASSAPASSAYTPVAYYAAGSVPTGPILLPTVPNGLNAYVQARSEDAIHRPSAWTTAVTLATVAMGAPTGLGVVVDPTDGSRATVNWATGANAGAALTDVFTRLSTLPASDRIRMGAGLLPGSISYPLSGLVPGESYIVTVEHRDAITGATAGTDSTFTAGSTLRTLNPPTNPVGIVGNTDPATGVGHMDGTYGLNVTAAELPGFVTFWEAIEDGVGFGTYGAFTQVSGMVPSVSGGPTTWRNVSANSLLRKQLKARHEAPGANASTYTSSVTLDAWGVVVSPPPPTATVTLPPVATLSIVSYDVASVTLGLSGTLGDGDPGPLEYHWRTDGGAWSAYSTSHPDQTIPRAKKATKVFQLQTRQSDGQESLPESFPVTGEFPAVDATTGLVNGLDASGVVTNPIPLPEAVANIPAISSTTGKLKPGVALDGTAYLPVHTGSAVAALTDGATVTAGAGRALAGLDASGTVTNAVPLAQAVANVTAISALTGKLRPNVSLDGTTGNPVHTAQPVSVLSDGAIVSDGADRAIHVVDAAYQVWADSAKPVKVGTPGVPSTLTKTVRTVSSLFVPLLSTAGWSRDSITLLRATTTPTTEFSAPLYLPLGATITQLRWRVFTTGTYGDFINLQLYKYDDVGSFTSVGSYNSTLAFTGYGTVTVSVSETLAAGYNYVLYCAFNGTISGVAGGHRLLYAETDYTIPSYDKGI